MQEPIIIAGFGRSGTTWVSDIVSKCLGGIILFEPDHPKVFAQSGEYIYQSTYSSNGSKRLKEHFAEVSHSRKSWLLRNHLPSSEGEYGALENMIWKESKVIGFKVIRWNHNLMYLHQEVSPKLIYIIRHPLSVVSSLMNRPNFFKEFGWETHWNLFKSRNPLNIDISEYDNSPLLVKYAVMWSISNITALRDLKILKLPYFLYENLYKNPYYQTRLIFEYLGIKMGHIHPSYLFYPSMVTLKTFHTAPSSRWAIDELITPFWKDTLSILEAEKVLEIVGEISGNFPEVKESFVDHGYLGMS